MMNEYQMKLEEGNKVTLPESLVNKLLLRKGETVCCHPAGCPAAGVGLLRRCFAGTPPQILRGK